MWEDIYTYIRKQENDTKNQAESRETDSGSVMIGDLSDNDPAGMTVNPSSQDRSNQQE